MSIFDKKNVSNLEIVAPGVTKISYDNGSFMIHSDTIWSISRDPNIITSDTSSNTTDIGMTEGSPNVTLAEPNPYIVIGQLITGSNVPEDTHVVSISGVNLVMSNNAISTITEAETLGFMVTTIEQTSGMLHLFQNGAAASIGYFGHWVSESTPLIINEAPITDIGLVSFYFLTNLYP